MTSKILIMSVLRCSFWMFLFVFCAGLCSAQQLDRQVLGAAGSSLQTDGLLWEYQVGEVSALSIRNENVRLKSGFIQSDWRQGTNVLDLPSIVFNVYPNPAGEHIFVQFSEVGSYSYRILDVYGRVHRTGICESIAQEIGNLSLNGLPSGTYLLHVSKKNQPNIGVVRFVKY